MPALTAVVLTAQAQTPAQVLIVINNKSPISTSIGHYYATKRSVPATNICAIDTPPDENISRTVYDSAVEGSIGRCLTRRKLTESILYIVATQGVPLRINGDNNQLQQTNASVDSELTLLYAKLHGQNFPVPGQVPNPFFGHRDVPFRHPQFPIYLVTRLAGYNMADLKRLVDSAPQARNTGKFVIDLRANNATPGNQWLRAAALLLPKDRVILDDTAKILSNIQNVIAYASWGSNDSDRHERFLHFQWLPGAIATEYVSTNGRTFKPPPERWKIGSWADPQSTWFAGAPQTLTGDYLHEGASGASGQVYEPYLTFCPRPDFVLPAYFQGRNLAESFYMGIPGLSWENVVVGDPLMRLQ
ncbi:MAG TPA: TIGR03790 family protein [Bryobacteraceae bacterium]|nr:TIGR03790 family protein [Bryobacteraceae bacterium]